ncbi:hypothetical protein [Spelaeicoccus albus]|uniref:DUF1453 domain-containing protein n=1 Tax=Spelaeicoccus albus TaxID=1280376 RepID=A0A7Z0CZA8_9MICO|nr:hypothetical protein [Spelaeicoccus albus]NYI66146.1 hypothetical protein [Spelaeicoccus albus]
MNPQIYLDVLIGVAVIGLVAYRQLSWGRVNPRKLLILPAVLAAIGLYDLKDLVAGAQSFTALDAWFIAGQTVIAVALGLIMGKVVKFKTDGDVVYSRAGAIGAALWIGFIAVRLGVDALAHASGATVAGSVSVIMLTVAVNRFTQNALVLSRYNAHSSERPARSLTEVR